MKETDQSESPKSLQTKQRRDVCFFLYFLRVKKIKWKEQRNKLILSFHLLCAVSPHITATEEQAGAATWTFCCVSGLAANHAHRVAATATSWERSSSSEVSRRAFYWPPWLSAERFFSFFCKQSVEPLPNSSTSLQPFMTLPRPQVRMRE